MTQCPRCAHLNAFGAGPCDLHLHPGYALTPAGSHRPDFVAWLLAAARDIRTGHALSHEQDAARLEEIAAALRHASRPCRVCTPLVEYMARLLPPETPR